MCSRKKLVQRLFTITGSLIFMSLTVSLGVAQQKKSSTLSTATRTNTVAKPNVVFVFVDDMGYKDAGYMGSDYYETPNVDKLAREGMIFTQAYAAAGNCAPSRASLMSGSYNPRHGVYAVGSTTRGPRNLMRTTPVPNTQSLNPSVVTVAEALKSAGYATAIFGKWHLGETPTTQPTAQGFDVYFDSRKENANKKRNEPDDPKGMFSLTKASCDFITQHKDKPFFLYLSHHAIHSSLEARPASIEKFKQKTPGKYHKSFMYAACLYDLDASVGILLEHLKSLGLDKNTLVVFTSDNGATDQSPQEPLRGNKGGYYEGGIKEPMLMRWPGVVKPGSISAVPIINQDLYPTFLEATKTPVPAKAVLDGESLVPVMSSKASLKRQAVFWHFPGYLDNPVIRGRDSVFRTRPVTVIRKGDWKMLLYHEEWLLDGGKSKLATNNAAELYNLKEDEGERINLVNQNTTKRDELVADIEAWWKKIGAKLPTPQPPDLNKKMEDENGTGNE